VHFIKVAALKTATFFIYSSAPPLAPYLYFHFSKILTKYCVLYSFLKQKKFYIVPLKIIV